MRTRISTRSLVLVIAVDNAEEVDRGLAHHLKPAAKPGFPGACPGSYKTFIAARPTPAHSPPRHSTSAAPTNWATTCSIAWGEKFGLSFCRFDGGVMRGMPEHVLSVPHARRTPLRTTAIQPVATPPRTTTAAPTCATSKADTLLSHLHLERSWNSSPTTKTACHVKVLS